MEARTQAPKHANMQECKHARKRARMHACRGRTQKRKDRDRETEMQGDRDRKSETQTHTTDLEVLGEVSSNLIAAGATAAEPLTCFTSKRGPLHCTLEQTQFGNGIRPRCRSPPQRLGAVLAVPLRCWRGHDAAELVVIRCGTNKQVVTAQSAADSTTKHSSVHLLRHRLDLRVRTRPLG